MMSKPKFTYYFAVLCLLLFTRAGWAQPAGYQFYKTVTINASQVQGSLTNFPVLINITDTELRDNVQSPNGYDIIFTTDFAGTTILDHQIESYNASTGELIVWVNVPSISSSSNTILYMFYDNSAVSTNPSVSDIWDNNYQLILHMYDEFDASSIGQNVTNHGVTSTSGRVGNGGNFVRNENDYISVQDNSTLDITGQITISFWYYPTNENPDIVIKGTGGIFGTTTYEAEISGGARPRFLKNGSNGLRVEGGSSLSTNTWYYLTFIQRSNGRDIYINGDVDVSDTNTQPFNTNNDDLLISRSGDAIDGKLDEVRISNIARSADWIKTEYNNQNNPAAFHTISAQYLIDVTAPNPPQNVLATPVLGGDIEVSFDDVDETGSGVASYSVKRSTSQGGPYTEIGTVTDNESSIYTFTDNTTTSGTTYYYVVTAIDNAINESAESTEASVTADGTPPTAPQNVTATAVTGGNIEIAFDDVDETGSGVASYSVKRSTSQGGPYTEIGTVTDNESSTYTFTDNTTTIGTIYYYVVTALDAVGNESSNSVEAGAESALVVDTTPPSLSATTVSGGELTLDYNEVLDGNSVPSTSDYIIRINGTPVTITSVDVNGDKVNIEFSPSVNPGDNVQIDYVAGTNPILDLAGNPAANLSSQNVNNSPAATTGFGPDPCPIVNGQDAAWACFDGINNGTTMRAEIGGLEIATVTAASGSQTTFAPNALQEWGSGEFAGDEYNGPQSNPTGNSGNATSFNINITSGVPSNSLVLALNRLRPEAGATSYTLEAFDGSNSKIAVDDWLTGQGTDGGVCTNTVNLVYSNGNTTIEFQPTVSGNSSCASSSTPIWFRITDSDVSRIEIRKVSANPDNIHLGLAIVADFGDAPNVYGTSYSSRTPAPAFHMLSNDGNNPVYLGGTVDGDGNGSPNSTSTGDDTESSGLDSGDDEDGISVMPDIRTDQSSYSVTLVCTDGAFIGGWIDFDQSDSFDAGEFDSGTCASGSVTLTWSGLSGLITGSTSARFRIASNINDVANPVGSAVDGEVEDYPLNIIPPLTPDLEIVKTVSYSQPIEGDTVAFVLTVTNPGEFMASGIQVTDQLPAGLTYISSTASQGTYDNSTGIWDIGTILDGDTTSVSLVINVSVNSGTLGTTITNSAAITALNQTDPELGNNSDSSGITVVPEASDIGILKIVDNSVPNENEIIHYTISVTNNGPRDATNLSIIDQLPTGLTFQSASPSVGTYNNSTAIWTIGALEDGASASLIIQVQVENGTVGNSISNTAAVNTIDQNDSNSGNDASTVTVDVVSPTEPTSCNERPLLVFENSTLLSGTALQVGAIYRFPHVMNGVYADVQIVAISNLSLIDIDDATSSSSIPEDFTPFIENIGGGNGYIDFKFSFYDSASGSPKYLSYATTGSDIDGTGDLVDYIGYQNLSSFTVESTTELISGSEAEYYTFESGDYSDTQPINGDFSDYMVYATYTNESTFKLRAGIKATNTQDDRIVNISFDPCKINDFRNPVIENMVDLAVTKTVDDSSPNVGQTIEYTLQVKNIKANAVGNIEVTDQLPSGLTFVSATPSQGTYNSGTGIWNIGNMTGLQIVSMVITATVNNGTQGNTITNYAAITNLSGNDLNTLNNSTSVDIIVYDPGSSLACSEPPTFSFDGYSLESGVAGQVNAIYRFQNVASGIDALVKIQAISNAILSDLDANSSADNDANFSPLFKSQNGTGTAYIDWKITFVETSTTTPVKRDFAMTGLDIDGWSTSGKTVRDYLGFSQNQASTVESGTNLNSSIQGPYQIFESSTTTDASGSFDTNHMAYISYNYTSTLEIRTGSIVTNGYNSDRLVDIDFRRCLNLEFDNPVTTTRNADIQVVKTVDETNPLENETVVYTITVTNNGPENATELDVNEELPAGMALVQATPSQGSYNQLSNIWAIGGLNSGSSVNLILEATVGSGFTQDSLVNQAYVLGLNQYDPISSNDSSKATIYKGIQIDGIVFKDKIGNGVIDGDTNFGDASGDQQGLENVEVHLFLDGGDGIADGTDDTYIRTDSTDNTGQFIFQVGNSGDFWVVVNSKTGGLSDGATWAEQTYAPIGALCADGTGNTTEKTVAGNCFGGRRGNQSDNISNIPLASDLINAEHIAKITVNSTGISAIDFGFSFNVVTDTRDGDDDLSSNRSVQGSLRQFITNANSISGANSMRFVPSVATNATGSGGLWWSITLQSALPAVTDPLTTISGIAYNLTAPTTVRDENPATLGSGGTVGVSQISLNTFTAKELELNLNNVDANAFSINSVGAVVVREIAVLNGENSINLQSISGGLIEANLIGTHADGTEPGSGQKSDNGIVLNGTTTTDVIIRQNYIGFVANDGVKSDNNNANVAFYKNEVYQTGFTNIEGNGLEIKGGWTIEQNYIHETGNSNSSAIRGGSGIEVSGSASGITIRNNTITNNKVTGINILNAVTNTLIEENIFTHNGTNYASSSPKLGAGVKLAFPDAQPQEGIKITHNSFGNNYGLAIDMVTTGGGEADGVTVNDGTTQPSSTQPNMGLDYPVITLATVSGTSIHVEGYVGTYSAKIAGAHTIEIYKANNDGNNDGLIEAGGTLIAPHGEGVTLIGSITTNQDGTFSEEIPIPSGVSVVLNDRITGITINSGNNTSEFGANQRIVPTGVTISGYVYRDNNHNAVREGGESGIQDVTLVLYNANENNCKSVKTDVDGYYLFTNVLNGDYEVIEAYGQSIPTPDVCRPASVDPVNYVSTTPNVREVTINNLPLNQNFGDFEGSKLTGTVFNDNGIGGGIANDGIQNGEELGIYNVEVKATSISGTSVYDQVNTNADGTYTLYISSSAIGGDIKIVETNLPQYLSTGASAGNTSGTYDRATDMVTFSYAVAQVYANVEFGDVEDNQLMTDTQVYAQAGSAVFLRHEFYAKTNGSVTFSLVKNPNPAQFNWSTVLYNDLNCNGDIDSGEPVLSNALAATAGQTICLILKITVPTGAPEDASVLVNINADFSFTNASPALSKTYTRSDIVTVGDPGEAGLTLVKTVNKTAALPGENLIYVVTYTNNSDAPLSQLEIVDSTPTYTSFVTAGYGALPSGLTGCTITAPAVAGKGVIKWNFAGSLLSGQSSTVTYTVVIDN